MNVVFVFDNCTLQEVNKEHVLQLDIQGMTLLKKESKTYDCHECNITLSREADKKLITYKNKILENTMFENIINNTITWIEVQNDIGTVILYLPSRIRRGVNFWQRTFKDKNSNLHICCKHGGFKNEKGGKAYGI